MIAVEIDGHRYTVDSGVWNGGDPRLLRALRIEEQSFRAFSLEAGGADPDRDLTSARHAVGVFGGRIVDLSKHKPPPYAPGRVY